MCICVYISLFGGRSPSKSRTSDIHIYLSLYYFTIMSYYHHYVFLYYFTIIAYYSNKQLNKRANNTPSPPIKSFPIKIP